MTKGPGRVRRPRLPQSECGQRWLPTTEADGFAPNQHQAARDCDWSNMRSSARPARSRDFACKVGKRFPEGRVSGAAERQRFLFPIYRWEGRGKKCENCPYLRSENASARCVLSVTFAGRGIFDHYHPYLTQFSGDGTGGGASDEHRRGRGTLHRQSRKATSRRAAAAARRSVSEFAERMSSGDARRRRAEPACP